MLNYTSSGAGAMYARNFSDLAGSEPDATKLFMIACDRTQRINENRDMRKINKMEVQDNHRSATNNDKRQLDISKNFVAPVKHHIADLFNSSKYEWDSSHRYKSFSEDSI